MPRTLPPGGASPSPSSSSSARSTTASGGRRADQATSTAPARSLPLDSLSSVGAALAARDYAKRGVASSGEVLRVLLVDDHTLMRAGLRALLRPVPDILVAGEAANGMEAVEEARRLRPHVVVMDLEMTGGDGVTGTRALMEIEPPPRILILTMHSEHEHLIPLLEAGASGYLAKDAADRELVDAIRAVAAGEVYVRPAVARLLASSLRERVVPSADPLHARYETLSDRERLVVQRVAEGYNGREIGRQLGISAKTVDTYKQRIEEKLGLSHRTDYVRFALALGLLSASAPSSHHGGLELT